MSEASAQPPNDRDKAVEQAVDEFLSRRAADPRTREESFVTEYPDLLPELGEHLRRLRLIDEARRLAGDKYDAAAAASFAFGTSLDVRCPSCQKPTMVIAATPWSEIACERCGNTISLVPEQGSSSGAPLSRIGHFELLGRRGVGAFGTVWRARDTTLERDVAIKIPRQEHLTATERNQFIHEARAVAQLRHPNIVSVHEVGQFKGFTYMVSDYVDGVSLADWLTIDKPDFKTIAVICRKLAVALQHAHMKGVVHRDIKSANILIDQTGEPHITDFGLAKRTNIDITTLVGDVLGTPAYMSPEQANGASHEADARSDIYSLGVVLFYSLTGQLPFRGTAQQVVYQVVHDKPPRPRRLSKDIPRELEAICLRCLEKDAARRYQSAKELADHLQQFLETKPTSESSKSDAIRSTDVRRTSTLVTVAGLFALVVVAAAVLSRNGPRANSPATSPPSPSRGVYDTALAKTEVIDSTPGRFVPLRVGAMIAAYDQNITWVAIPPFLETQPWRFWQVLGTGSGSDPSPEYGRITFRAATSGPVWIAVTTRFGGGGSRSGDWTSELVSRADLEANGWREITTGLTAVDVAGQPPTLEFMIFERDVVTGESFTLRTEKYHPPILLTSEERPASR